MSRVLAHEGIALLEKSKRLENRAENNAERERMASALDLFVRTLDEGGKFVVTGIGKSGKIGQKISATFLSIGAVSVFLHPSEALHGDLGQVRPGDLILAISHSGNSDELLKLLSAVQGLGVRVVAIVGNPQSKLAERADAWIEAATEEASPENLVPTTSSTLALALGDALAVALMRLKRFESKDFAANHPGGSLGKRLSLKVRDLMRTGEDVGLVGPETSVEDVLIRSTEKKLGAVLVVHGSELLGIITDGDIRRALQHRDRFFSFKAKDVMTSKPVSASPDMKAIDALHLMEQRKSQISVLPVIEASGKWLGLLRLHDIAQIF